MKSRKIALLGAVGCIVASCVALAGCNDYNGPLRSGAILPPQSTEIGVSPYFSQPSRTGASSTSTATPTTAATH